MLMLNARNCPRWCVWLVIKMKLMKNRNDPVHISAFLKHSWLLVLQEDFGTGEMSGLCYLGCTKSQRIILECIFQDHRKILPNKLHPSEQCLSSFEALRLFIKYCFSLVYLFFTCNLILFPIQTNLTDILLSVFGTVLVQGSRN